MDKELTFICYSHLRWDFVFQRPQHLLSRCAREYKVYYVEEPVYDSLPAHIKIVHSKENVTVVVPMLPEGTDGQEAETLRAQLLNDYFESLDLTDNNVLWYYTPMALTWMKQPRAKAVIYDCMDELSMFKGAPAGLLQLEEELFRKASLVFTGGISLYEHKRSRHRAVYPFPSSVDFHHFAQARSLSDEPEDQRNIAHPRLGFFGVIDERFDIDLLRGVAEMRPDFQWVILGPVVKIDPATLPKAPNIHYLGSKKYDELPSYISGWDVALLLFARNDSTRFISPTKTPEYLAAGKPVVSTSIRDVVSPYEQEGLVRIADQPHQFIECCLEALEEDRVRSQHKADAFLGGLSWDKTWSDMRKLILESCGIQAASTLPIQSITVSQPTINLQIDPS